MRPSNKKRSDRRRDRQARKYVLIIRDDTFIDRRNADHKGTIIPETPGHVMENYPEVMLAIDFIKHLESLPEDSAGEPLGVTVAQYANGVTIRWFATGDPDAARARLRELQEGRARL